MSEIIKMNRERRRKMKNILTDVKGEAALDLIANIIEPISVLAADDTVKTLLSEVTDDTNSAGALMKFVTYILREHKKEVLQILAATEGKRPEDCDFTIKSLFVEVNNLIHMITEDEELADIRDFLSELSTKDLEISSGSAMAPITETVKK